MKFKLGKLEIAFLVISAVWGIMRFTVTGSENISGNLGEYAMNLIFIWIVYFAIKFISGKITKKKIGE